MSTTTSTPAAHVTPGVTPDVIAPASLPLTVDANLTDLTAALTLADGDGRFRNGTSVEDVAHDNTRRAGAAAVALRAFWEQTGADVDLGTALTDLLASLHHLADAVGEDFESLAACGAYQYRPQLAGEL
jgi:hypothetical protein